MAIQRRQRPSIYLTFKVLQLIHQLRRRIRPRILSDTAERPILGSETCLGLEVKAFSSINKSLAKASRLRDKKQLHHVSNRVCKTRNSNRRCSKLHAPEQHHSVNPNTSGEEVQQSLKTLDTNFAHANNALSAIAANEKLFIEQNTDPNFDACTLNEIIAYLLMVHEGIQVLYSARSQHDDQWLISQGCDIGLNIDEAFIANYEHLLLRLQTQLIDALTRKVVEALLEGNHDKKQRKLLNWFSEFPNNRHPLSTTWPWSIKPSLAVLWGVCWMFHDRPPTGDNGHGQRIPQLRLLQDEQFLDWNTPQPNDYFNFGLEALTGTLSQPQTLQPASGDVGSVDGGVEDLRQNIGSAGWQLSATNDLSRVHVQGHQHHRTSAAAQPQFRRNANPRHRENQGRGGQFAAPDRHRGPIARLGPTTHLSGPTAPSALLGYNTYASTSHASAALTAQDIFSPDNSGIATTQVYAFSQPQPHVESLNDSWPNVNFNYQSSAASSLPHRHENSGHLTNLPDIRVTANDQAADTEGFTAPHPDYLSTLYEQGQQAPQASPQSLNNNIRLSTDFSTFPNINIMGNCPPETSPIHTQQIMRQRSPSDSKMPTPVSLSAPRSPLRSPVDDRRRSIASAFGHGHQRHTSVNSVASMASVTTINSDSSSQDGDDALSLRRNNTYKRAEEPPRNAEGKMVCKIPECNDVTFERKCEWSKHMDKHDRPYKCNVKGCEKLQGFTYSGGLLRHEREVHKMHGGTKKSLYCPFPDCKRHSGSGFTRKENLAEHIRRVHRRTSTSSDLGNLIIRPSDAQDETTDIHLPSEDYQRPAQAHDDDAQLALKRKRTSFSEEGDESDLRSELKRLRRENEEKDGRLRQLEEAVKMLQRGR